jgi:hypothetical protein
VTLTQTKPQHEGGGPQDLLIEEAHQHHRRRLIRIGVSALLALIALAAGAYLGGIFRSSPSPGKEPPAQSDRSPATAAHATRPAFVLTPTWLPPGFSASGGGYVDPPGGLKFGAAVDVSVGIASTGATPVGQAKTIPVVFTLDYYGYHNPESKSIRLTGLRNGFPASGTTTALGGRHVSLASSFSPGYFGGNSTSSASWVERSVYFNVIAQGITKGQLARFVAGLKEQAPPVDIRVPSQRAGTSQVDACNSLRHSGFRCVAQFDALVSTAPVGTVVGTKPGSGTLAAKGSYVTLEVSSSGTLSRISSVLGKSLREAKGALGEEGFVTQASCVVASQNISGTVVGQTPIPGSPVENGYRVRLAVAQRSC